MADLITLANLKTYLFPGETNTTYDTILETIIDAVSARVRGAVGCDILTTTYTSEEVTGRGTKYLDTKHWPITSVTTVTDQDGNTYTAGVTGDYTFDDYSIVANSTTWSNANKYYIVTYVAGHATLPSDLTLLCYELCMEKFKAMKDKWAGEASRSFPDGSVSLLTDKEFTKDQRAVICRYRRPRV